MSTADIETIDAMRRFGGGFVKALAEAAARADDLNLALIKATWPGYWEQYEQMAAQAPKGQP